MTNFSIRNTNIEILRFVLISSVCLWHICIYGFQFMHVGTENYEYGKSVVIPFFCCLFSPAVYCFMYISGYYGIKFKLEKLLTLCILGVLCYYLGRIIQLLTGTVSLYTTLRYVFPISSRYWWFLTSYIFVYVVSPIINKGIELIEKKTLTIVIVLMTILEVLSLLTLKANSGSNFYGLMYMYILGRYFKITPMPSLKRWHMFCGYTSSLLILYAIVYYTSQMEQPYSKMAFVLLSYNNSCTQVSQVKN